MGRSGDVERNAENSVTSSTGASMWIPPAGCRTKSDALEETRTSSMKSSEAAGL